MCPSRPCVVAALALAVASAPVARADHPARQPMVGVDAGVASGHERAAHVGGWVGVDLTRRLALLTFLQWSTFDHGGQSAVGGGVRLWPWSRLYVEGRVGYVVELRDAIAGAVHDGRQPICDDHESACGWITGGTLGVELARDDAFVLSLRLDVDHASAAPLSRDTVGVALAVEVY